MEITVSDDRPPLLPILAAGLLAGVVGVLAAALLGVAGMAPSGLRSLLGIGIGLLVGLLLKDRLIGLYEARWGGAETDDSDATAAGSGDTGEEAMVDGPDSSA